MSAAYPLPPELLRAQARFRTGLRRSPAYHWRLLRDGLAHYRAARRGRAAAGVRP